MEDEEHDDEERGKDGKDGKAGRVRVRSEGRVPKRGHRPLLSSLFVIGVHDVLISRPPATTSHAPFQMEGARIFANRLRLETREWQAQRIEKHDAP